MIEKVFLAFGLGFSILVYFLSIRPAKLSHVKKAFYFVLSLIGITGTLFLIGILIAHALSRFRIL